MGNCRFFTLFSKKACNSLFSVIIYLMFRKEMPACRNGRRGRLKICCGQPRAGSSPAAGSIKTPNSCKSWSLVFFLYSVFYVYQLENMLYHIFFIFSPMYHSAKYLLLSAWINPRKQFHLHIFSVHSV